jgi:hypothetical protein
MKYKVLFALKFLSVFNLCLSSQMQFQENDCLNAKRYSVDLFNFCEDKKMLQPCRLSPNEVFDEEINKCVCQRNYGWDRLKNLCVRFNFVDWENNRRRGSNLPQLSQNRFVRTRLESSPHFQAEEIFRREGKHIVPSIRLIDLGDNGIFLFDNLAQNVISEEKENEMRELYNELKPMIKMCNFNSPTYNEDCANLLYKWHSISDWVNLFENPNFQPVTFEDYLKLKKILQECLDNNAWTTDKCIEADRQISELTPSLVQDFRDLERLSQVDSDLEATGTFEA